MALAAYPCGRVVVPLMADIVHASEGGLDVLPAPLVIEAAPDQFGDESAPLTSTRPAVELGDQVVIQRYVQSHVQMMAHTMRVGGVARTRRMASLVDGQVGPGSARRTQGVASRR